MSRKVKIEGSKERGIHRMIDVEDEEVLVELYDNRIDQEQTLLDLAEKLGYVLVYEYVYETHQ